MKMSIIEAYLDDLIKNSTLDVPAWNIEAARKGGKSGWNYIDGCMILAMIETWKITGEKKYLDFAEAYICLLYTSYNPYTNEVKEVFRKSYSEGLRAKVNCYGANSVPEGVAIMWKEGVDVSITGNSTNPTRFQHQMCIRDRL